MPIINKLKTLFSKQKTVNKLSISICQNSVSFCYFEKNKAIQCQALPLIENSYPKTLLSLSEQLQLTANAMLVIPPKLSHSVQLAKPSIPDEEMHAALKWQVKDLVPIPPENIVLDYYDTPQLPGGVEKINVVCAPFDELKSLTPTLMNDNINLETILVEELAFAGLVSKREDACLLVCQQPNEEIIILVVKNGQLYFNRRLRGFSQIAQKTQQELEMGIVDSLSLEIQRSTDYFERQLKQAPIKSIEVIVPIQNEAFLARKLSENTNISVNLLSLPEGCQEYRQFAVVIGASMLTVDTDEEDATEASEELGISAND